MSKCSVQRVSCVYVWGLFCISAREMEKKKYRSGGLGCRRLSGLGFAGPKRLP